MLIFDAVHKLSRREKKHVASLSYHAFRILFIEWTDQTVRMRSLIWAFVYRMQQNEYFLRQKNEFFLR